MITTCVSISYGEIALKKDNRPYFVRCLKNNIKRELNGIEYEIKADQSKLFIYSEQDKQVLDRLLNVYGIAYVGLQYETDLDMESIYEAALLAVKNEMERAPFKTFKVETKRANKEFALTSPEINGKVGAAILKAGFGLEVDVNHPDRKIRVDIRKTAFVSSDRLHGLGGMPVGSNGRAISLLSGGIDSPVASILAMKRGLSVDFVHFHSYPFTSGRSFDKTKDLATLASKYEPYSMLFSFNLLPMQEVITKNCDIRFTTLLQRRSMMRIATRMAKSDGRTALITGENLGQVASQTLEGMSVVDPVTDLIILRPLITYDKNEIIDLARKYGTFEKSIEPYEDCCTVFVAKHPRTNPTLEDVLKEEEKIDYEKIEAKIFESFEEYKIK